MFQMERVNNERKFCFCSEMYAKMQDNSNLMWKKFEIWGWSILKAIQAFHTVRT